jgi:hypothetical protein
MSAKDDVFVSAGGVESADPLEVTLDGWAGRSLRMTGKVDGF